MSRMEIFLPRRVFYEYKIPVAVSTEEACLQICPKFDQMSVGIIFRLDKGAFPFRFHCYFDERNRLLCRFMK